jgi:uncharacterized protein (DUF433 family)
VCSPVARLWNTMFPMLPGSLWSGGDIRRRPVLYPRITVDPKQMAGVPCIRALRIPAASAVAMIADGMTPPEIIKAYPDLESDDIGQALRYATEAVQERELPPTGS